MSNPIVLKKIVWKKETRIFIDAVYDIDIISKVKTIPGRRYSKTKNLWHIPYSKQAYNSFQNLDLTYSIDKPSGTAVSTLSPFNEQTKGVLTSIDEVSSSQAVLLQESTDRAADIEIDTSTPLSIVYNDRSFIIHLPFSKKDVQFIKGLKRWYWHKKNKAWIVSATVDNARLIQGYFAYWNVKMFSNLLDLIQKTTDPLIVELYISPEAIDKVALKVKGFRADFEFVKSIPHREYDKQYKRWLIPNDEHIISSLIAHYTSKGAKVINRIPKKNIGEYTNSQQGKRELLDQLLSKCPTHKEVLRRYADTLLAQSYSRSTMKTYLFSFYKYVSTEELGPIETRSTTQVNDYIIKVAKKGVSDSHLNIVVSAIKFYYIKVIFLENFEIHKIKRPRKGRPLPSILSMPEVKRMLESTQNLKHKCILYTLYSSGLRISELINLRVTDMFWDRNQLLIKGAKGKKDRYVQFSKLTQLIMKEYINTYMPQYWVFEGADRQTNYSSTSIQKVVKAAAKKANISRRVTPHMLRHSYATHSMDHGIDLRIIQELLGHKDIKTTLIYTHVTNKTLQNIESPLDILERELNIKRNFTTE